MQQLITNSLLRNNAKLLTADQLIQINLSNLTGGNISIRTVTSNSDTSSQSAGNRTSSSSSKTKSTRTNANQSN